jgi:hypothetical protein
MGSGSKISCIETRDREGLIRYFYEEEDDRWHSKVHENEGTCQENILDSLKTITRESSVFRVEFDGEIAGFFTKFKDEYGNQALEAFHIKKSFRRGWFFEQFWDVVRKAFGGEFWIGVYEKNIEAVSHIQRQGFEFEKTAVHRNNRIFIFKSNK